MIMNYDIRIKLNYYYCSKKNIFVEIINLCIFKILIVNNCSNLNIDGNIVFYLIIYN